MNIGLLNDVYHDWLFLSLNEGLKQTIKYFLLICLDYRE